MTNRPMILIVDDEPRMLEVLEVALQAAGYRTLTAPTRVPRCGC